MERMKRSEGFRTTERGPGVITTLGLVLLTASAAYGGLLPAAQTAEESTAERSPLADVAIGPSEVEEPSMPGFPLEPPDGKWLIDEEGQEYIISRWPKVEGHYRWLDQEAGRVRFPHLPPFTAIDHDDGYFYFRVDKPEPVVVDPGPTEEEIAAVAASYRMEVPEVDRIHLRPWGEGLPEVEQWRNGFAIADMNGDGHLDLVHPPARKTYTAPIILLGDSAGTWTYWREASFPDLPYDYGDVAVGDLDQDGKLDMVLAMHLTGILALRGDGNGAFTTGSEGLPLRVELARKRQPGPPSTTSWNGARARREPVAPVDETPVAAETAPRFSSRAIALADWNGDGRLDVLAVSEGPTSLDAMTKGQDSPLGKLVFLNEGDGSWTTVAGPGRMLGDVILPVDLDGDGKLDFVTDSSLQGSGEILNYGSGESWESVSLPDPRTRLYVASVAVADFDADGRQDVAVAFQASELGIRRYGIDVFFGEPERQWRRESIFALPDGATRAFPWMTAGDVDQDGDPDLLALSQAGDVWIFANQGDGEFVRELAPEAAPGPQHHYCTGYRGALEDLDRDGRDELIAVFAGEPGSESMLLGAIPSRCQARGAIRVWKIAPGSADGAGEDGGGGATPEESR